MEIQSLNNLLLNLISVPRLPFCAPFSMLFIYLFCLFSALTSPSQKNLDNFFIIMNIAFFHTPFPLKKFTCRKLALVNKGRGWECLLRCVSILIYMQFLQDLQTVFHPVSLWQLLAWSYGSFPCKSLPIIRRLCKKQVGRIMQEADCMDKARSVCERR